MIFDTDIGNDVDDVLALGMIHALESRKECELLAVTVSNSDENCAPFVDAVNTFYGRGEIPIGVMRDGPKSEPSKFLKLADERDGDRWRYPHDLMSGRERQTQFRCCAENWQTPRRIRWSAYKWDFRPT